MIEIKYSQIEIIFVIILVIVASIQILYYLLFYLRISIKKKVVENQRLDIPVSIIICAKNEEENLRRFLPKVFEQQYKNYEVIIVNDCSTDNTETYITNLQLKYPNLKYTFIKEDPKFKHSKKLAVTIGIKAAMYNHFVFIDADCYPETDLWLTSIVKKFGEKTQLVLGYGGYIQGEGFLDKLVRYDTFFIAVNYFSFARVGLPYMGVGRNMAYTRDAYMQSSRFTKHYHITSGDDDLFVCEIGRKGNTAVELSENGYTRSEQVETFKQWCSQKRRHITTAHKYRFIHKLLLGLEPVSRLLFYLLALLYFVLGFSAMWYIVISLVFVRLVSQLIINNLNMKRLHESKILVYSPLFDIIIPIFVAIFFIQNKLNNRRRRWK